MAVAQETIMAVAGSAAQRFRLNIIKCCGREATARSAMEAFSTSCWEDTQASGDTARMPPRQGSGWACRERDSGRCAGVSRRGCK